MLRVPGSTTDLLALKARGADVRIVYSPLDALKIARRQPRPKQVVFFAVGFETTAPANAMAVAEAARRGIDNFSVLVSHVLVPPAMTALLDSPANQVQAFLAAGHVCAVMGWTEYEPIAARYRVPIVVTGFEPLDLLEGILMAIRQLEEGRFEVENQYARAVRREGVPPAQRQVAEVFEVGARTWRGIGEIPMSGYRLRPAFARFDAERRFDVGDIRTSEHPACIAGAILTGERTPLDCTAYGTLCSPRQPLGAPMVSSEGTCAAFFAAGPRGRARAAGSRRRSRCVLAGPGAAVAAMPATDGVRWPRVDPGRSLACPAPIPEDQRVILGHGSGGQLSGALMRDVIAPALAGAAPGGVLNDAAIVEVGGHAPRVHHRLVRRVADPVPGRGHRRARGQRHAQRPRDDGRRARRPEPRVRHRGGAAARGAARDHGLGRRAPPPAPARRIVTGDTKVVGRGAADGLFVNTAGIGIVPAGVAPSADRAAPGDAVILSGPIGLHGVAVMSVREGLEFEVEIESDTQSLTALVAAMVAVEPDIHVLRDPTRGGLASALNEIAGASGVGMVLDEPAIPVPGPVRAACEFLGLDPLHVANEGKLVAIVPAASADAVLAAMRGLAEGADAARIGEVVADHPGMVTIRTIVGSERIVDMLVGEQLPRIC